MGISRAAANRLTAAFPDNEDTARLINHLTEALAESQIESIRRVNPSRKSNNKFILCAATAYGDVL